MTRKEQKNTNETTEKDLPPLEDFSPLENLLQQLRSSNLQNDTKEYTCQLLRKLTETQAKSFIDTENLQKVQTELEETIIDLKAKLETTQNRGNSEQTKGSVLFDNTMNTSSFRSGLNRSLPVLPLYQTSERMDDLTRQPPLRQSLQNENQRSGNHDDYSITTTQLANALVYALPGGLETPKKFNGTAKEAIDWIYQYENIAKGNNWSETKMIHKLLLYLINSASYWYELDISEKENDLTWKQIKEKFYKHFLSENYHKYIKRMIKEFIELAKAINNMVETFCVKSSVRGTSTYDGRPKCKQCGRTNRIVAKFILCKNSNKLLGINFNSANDSVTFSKEVPSNNWINNDLFAIEVMDEKFKETRKKEKFMQQKQLQFPVYHHEQFQLT